MQKYGDFFLHESDPPNEKNRVFYVFKVRRDGVMIHRFTSDFKSESVCSMKSFSKIYISAEKYTIPSFDLPVVSDGSAFTYHADVQYWHEVGRDLWRYLTKHGFKFAFAIDTNEYGTPLMVNGMPLTTNSI